jgi:hypothetical protein
LGEQDPRVAWFRKHIVRVNDPTILGALPYCAAVYDIAINMLPHGGYYLGIKVTHRDSEEYLKNALPPWHNVCVSYVPG